MSNFTMLQIHQDALYNHAMDGTVGAMSIKVPEQRFEINARNIAAPVRVVGSYRPQSLYIHTRTQMWMTGISGVPDGSITL